MNARALSTDVLLGMAPIVLVIALWQALVSFGTAPLSLLPPPGQVFLRLAQQLVSGGFLHEIAATLWRLFAGFSIAVMLGVGFGLAAAVNPEALKYLNRATELAPDSAQAWANLGVALDINGDAPGADCRHHATPHGRLHTAVRPAVDRSL